MAKIPQWEFVSTGGGRDDGIHNSMIEHFAGNHNYHLAREIIQNSLDAKLEGSKDPVTVVFKLIELKEKEFPGHDQLVDTLTACKKYYKADKDTQDFTTDALKCIKSPLIPFLKISDFNTKGLIGEDDDKKGGWYNLIKSTGATSKTEGEGGSFGIGKGAPFAASNLRVVFYSTKTKNGGVKFQGIAELVSHEFEKDIKRGTGSFGYGQGSIQKLREIPKKFVRNEIGTDILIAGYKNSKGWQTNLVKSILRNFWYALLSNDLIVKVEDIEINQNNLEHFLTEYFVQEPFKDDVEPSGNPLQYYLSVKTGRPFEETLPTLGKVKFFFNSTEEQLNYVSMIRKSHMVIYSRRFNFPGNFAGVFICDEDKGNRQLRKMEPPAHDKWIPERNKEYGALAMNEIKSFIMQCLDKMKITKNSGILDIPDLYKYLPDDDGQDDGQGAGGSKYTGEEAKIESSKLIQKREVFDKPVMISPFKVSVINMGTPDGQKKKGIKRKGKKRSKNRNDKFVELDMESRSFLVKRNKDSIEYIIILKSDERVYCNLKISAVGEEGSENLKIRGALDKKGVSLKSSGNIIHNVQLEKGKETRAYVTIDSTVKVSLKIDAYAIQ